MKESKKNYNVSLLDVALYRIEKISENQKPKARKYYEGKEYNTFLTFCHLHNCISSIDLQIIDNFALLFNNDMDLTDFTYDKKIIDEVANRIGLYTNSNPDIYIIKGKLEINSFETNNIDSDLSERDSIKSVELIPIENNENRYIISNSEYLIDFCIQKGITLNQIKFYNDLEYTFELFIKEKFKDLNDFIYECEIISMDIEQSKIEDILDVHTYEINVSYEMAGSVYMIGTSKETAIQRAKEKTNEIWIPLPEHSEYISDSFKIDEE